MADLDFAGSAAPVATEDPAADFLAREQSALGDLDEDFAFSNDSQTISDVGETKDAFTNSETEISMSYIALRGFFNLIFILLNIPSFRSKW